MRIPNLLNGGCQKGKEGCDGSQKICAPGFCDGRRSRDFDVIRYFGNRGKIFNVHFRDIRGGFLNFQETFIDDGDVDMLQAMRV